MTAFILTYKRMLSGIALLLLLVLFRMIWYGSLQFGFLFWNLFLALLPLWFSFLLGQTRHKQLPFVYAALWLLFFPNAAYLLTDIVHLRPNKGIRYWVDLVLLFTAGAYGVALGLLSLRKMEDWYGAFLPAAGKSICTFILLLGCGYGMYLGRVERWNSWDVVVQPISLLKDMLADACHPYRSREAWMLTLLFGFGLQLCYLLLGRSPDKIKI